MAREGRAHDEAPRPRELRIPNGIAFAPDEQYLYLSAGRVVKRYEVRPDGTLGGSIVFSEGDGIGDGIKTDRAGNVYSTSGAGPGIVRIMAPDGTLLGTQNLPVYGDEPSGRSAPTSAFGGNDGRSLYLTACDAVYRIRLRTPGIVPGPLARAGGYGTLGHR